MEHALSPMLAGKNALQFDSSKNAKALDEILENNNVDSGNPYLVINLKESIKSATNSNAKGFFAAIKAGTKEEKERQKTEKKKVEDAFYLALYDDYTAFYEYRDEVLTFKECKYDEIFSAPGDDLELPFSQENYTSSSLNEYFDLLARFEVIYKANLAPFKKELFGTALRYAEAMITPETKGSLADELKKLADLKSEGLLTDEEFAAAKAALLKN
jgi:hypothetical protein